MDETPPFTTRAWESFYVIVGSSAGALTGLQFVVLTLITEAGMIRGTGEALSAFGSPNVVHFCAALLVSAILSAPWHDLGAPGVAIAIAGVFGFVYSVAVLRDVRHTRARPRAQGEGCRHAGQRTTSRLGGCVSRGEGHRGGATASAKSMSPGPTAIGSHHGRFGDAQTRRRP